MRMTAQSGSPIPGSTTAAAPSGDTLVDHPDLARLSAVLTAPQVAVRARLNAIILDLLLLTLASLPVAISASTSSSGRALVFLVVEFAYFFALELRGGRTIGKRVFHVRVVAENGAPATARQIAFRNALRPVDALPFLYASGLISMIRTGPGRRQRIGDVAAGTTVVLDAGGKPLQTPSWLLPALTLLATLLSLAVVITVLSKTGDGAGQAPVEGVWLANATTIRSTGHDPRPDTATWTITRHCPVTSACGLTLNFQAPGEEPVSAPLVAGRGAWLAMFPALTYPCGEAPGGQTLYWQQHSVIALRFSEHGLAAEGEERDFSQSPSCGVWAAARRWTARWARLLS